mgnify:CR=1 FL=1
MSDPVDSSIVDLLTRMDAALGALLCMSFALFKLGATAFKPVIHQCLCGSSSPSIVKSCLLIEGAPGCQSLKDCSMPLMGGINEALV